MDNINIDKAIRNMPRDVRDRLRELVDSYNRTHDYRYAEQAIALVADYDDPAVKELVRTLRRR